MKIIETYKIPAKFNLLGTEWKVFTDKEVLVKDVKCFGSVDPVTRTIRLKNGHLDMFNTLIHELSHILGMLTDIDTEKCNCEVFAKINSLFWMQVFQQIRLVNSKPLEKKCKSK